MTLKKLTNNEFQMWRAVFAFAFTDGVLSLEEKNILSDHLKNVELTEQQKEQLVKDMRDNVSVEGLYKKITDDAHKQLFCDVSRTLAWCKGDIDKQDEEILKRVSCLKSTENRTFMEKSSKSSIFNRYLKQYLETGRIGAHEPLALFEAWA